MSVITTRGRRCAIGVALLFAMVIAAPATAQVVKAEVGVDGMT